MEASEGKAELLEALDNLAWAWLQYRDGGEAKATATAFVDEVLDVATAPDPEPEPHPTKTYYRPAEAADALGLNSATLGHWVVEGIVPTRNDGRNRVISGDTVERIRGLLLATPEKYKSPAKFVARSLRMERFGDTRARLPYPSQNKIRGIDNRKES